MVRATIGGTVIAEAGDDDLVAIEGNYYFPRSTLSESVLKDSPTPYTCPWKGAAQYHDVVTEAGGGRSAVVGVDVVDVASSALRNGLMSCLVWLSDEPPWCAASSTRAQASGLSDPRG